MKPCSIDDCADPARARSWCWKHYLRWRKHGSPTAAVNPKGQDFWTRVILGHGCWEWQGGDNGVGYGKLWHGGRMVYAHRRSFEMVHGSIPPGTELDHLCRNRKCVRPSHLEAVTRSENVRRAWPHRRVMEVL